MILQRRFSDQELEQIIEEATIYMCACPGQVAVQLRTLRELFRYQGKCEIEPGNDVAVHQAIAAATIKAYAVMEDCLDQVLELEGWDRATLQMPEGLRRKRAEMLDRDD
ncbi:hypothetical protein [Quatrionicoccus australiensis]|uniref:hypothetical protein n=1 Tax=Quatrionicoccus australiensis TaxID=138118 RepID=UPI001CF7EEA9|nr:hypothetical protein [Quatrionicoccus australiensis]